VISGDPEVRWRLAANLSSGGMFVKDDKPATPGTMVLVEFLLPDGQPLYRVAGKVAHQRMTPEEGKPVGMGLEFVDFDQNARELIQAFRDHAARTQADAQARAKIQQTEPRGPAKVGSGREHVGQRAVANAATTEDPIIGIDLGTTNSCAAICEQGQVRVLSAADGYETVPSVVFVEAQNRVFVGHRALQKMLLAPDKAIYGSKRFIGRPFASREVQSYGHFFRYGLVGDQRGMAAARLGDRIIPLEAVAGLILQHMKRMASEVLGKEVVKCVITCPAYFGEAQRRAVVEAGRMAGLTVERILSEPTAAAVAYGYGRGLKKNVIVYDFGGGTFDASVLRINGAEMEVLATDGDPFLGGSDFDDRITEYLCMVVEQKHGIDLRHDPVAVQRLRAAAEMAKQHVSQQQKATIELPYLQPTPNGPLNFNCELTREQCERLTQDLVMRSIRIVDEILHRAGLTAQQVDEIIMAGGQSRSPFIHRYLTERFGKKPSMRVHPDHAVAIGAAIVAAAAHGKAQVQLTDILPASLRLVANTNKTKVILPRGTKLPARTKFQVEAQGDDVPEFRCTLVRGELETVDGNELLGTVRLPSSFADSVHGAVCDVVVDVSADGLLTLAIRHPQTKEVQALRFALLADGKATDEMEDDIDIEVVDE
jgi:molecular chaperone DnaK